MSVIVKGMEMPTSCASCRMAVCFADTGRAKCYATLSYIDPERGKRSYDCPLRSLPEKHGRLIDADDMERFMSDTVQGDIRQYPYSDTLWDMAFKWIDSRPTIVEAEGE